MNDVTEETATDKATEIVKAEAPAQSRPALVAGARVQAIIPTTIDETWRVARAFLRAGTVPDAYKKNANDEQVVSRVITGIMAGAEVGLPPMMSLKNITIINGMPAIWGDAAIGLVQASNLLRNTVTNWTGEELKDDWTCTVKMWREGQDEPYIGEFSVGDAKRAKLWGKGGPWSSYPARMLFNRARAFCIRNGFADCLVGLQIAEEARDMPERTDPQKPDLSMLDDAPRDITEDVTEIETETQIATPEAGHLPEGATEDGGESPDDPPSSPEDQWRPFAETVKTKFAEAGSLLDVNTIAENNKTLIDDFPEALRKECDDARAEAFNRCDEGVSIADMP